MATDFFAQELAGNSLETWLIALGCGLGFSLVLFLVQRLFMGRLERWAASTTNDLDDLIIKAINRDLLPGLHVLSFVAVAWILQLDPSVQHAADLLFFALIAFMVVRFSLGILTIFVRHLQHKAEGVEGGRKVQNYDAILVLAKVLAWVVGFLLVLDNSGVDITTLLAGLGIGGIAIALAAQAVLGDLFSAFIIYFDRPFELGDFIRVGEHAGTVEHIGIKNTRIRSLSGEQISLSNSDLTSSRVRNFKRMDRRRVEIKLGLVYSTPLAKVKEVPGVMASIIGTMEGATLDRAHFSGFGDSALLFEAVYFVETGDYLTHMNIQQSILLAIKEAFEGMDLEFAFPSQSIYLAK